MSITMTAPPTIALPFDPAEEQLVHVGAVPDLPWLKGLRAGQPLHPTTVARWARVGLHGVRLEVLRIGNSMFTSEEALRRFFGKLSAVKVA